MKNLQNMGDVPRFMRAAVVERAEWPNPMPLRDVPVPSIQDDEVLVRVHAAGLNFADKLLIEGSYQEAVALPFVPGAELCGAIVATGGNAGALQPGMRVMGQVSSGAYAQYAVLHRHRLAPVPSGMPSDVAAGFYIPYGTALCALQARGRLKAGETVLVLGAAGGVGLAAVQVAKAMGATVIGAAAGHKRGQVLEAGADIAIAYDGADLREAVMQATQGQGVDVVFDTVGGAMATQAARCLRFEGRLLVIGFTSGEAPVFRANHVLVKNIDIVGCYWGPYQTLKVAETAAAFATLADWYEKGLLRPSIAAHVDLEGVGAALQGLVERRYAGKVIVNIDPSHKGEQA